MNKLVVVSVLLLATRAYADAPAQPQVSSPYGSSPYVIAYEPPPEIDSAHRGFTLELALGGGTTSVDASAGSGSFAIGGWLSHDVALTFRLTQVGSFGFVGGSVQYFATPSFWLGGGVGSMSELGMDEYGGTASDNGLGTFARVGYQLTGHKHALYISGEVQAGSIDANLRETALVALGYQLL